MITWMPKQTLETNCRPAGQSNGSDNLSVLVAAPTSDVGTVAELDLIIHTP